MQNLNFALVSPTNYINYSKPELRHNLAIPCTIPNITNKSDIVAEISKQPRVNKNHILKSQYLEFHKICTF